MKLTVSQRIWGGFIFLTLLLLLIGGSSLWRIASIGDSTQSVNQLSLPALKNSSQLQNEFILSSKTALTAYHSTELSQLQATSKSYQQAQQRFNTSLKTLKETVKSEPTLTRYSNAVDSIFSKFSVQVSQLIDNKKAVLTLRQQAREQFDTVELNAEDAISVLLDITDLEGLEELDERAYMAASQMENNLSALITASNDSLNVNSMQTLEIVKKDQLFYLGEIERSMSLMQTSVSQLDADLYNDLDSYVADISDSIKGENSLANNKLALLGHARQAQQNLDQADTITKQAIEQLDQLVAKVDELALQQQALVTSNVSAANVWTWTGMIIASIIAILVATLTIRSITRPLDEVNRILNLVASGDMTQRLDDSNQDEFGELATSCNTLIESLRSLIQGIITRSTQLAAASEQTSTITAETSHAIESQRTQVEQAATATTEMSSTSQAVNESAQQALEAVKNADNEANHVRGISDQNRMTIEQLAIEVDNASSVINQLHQDSASIGGILDVIRGIAEQTNLLALNAAIEAARAGEQGRGFAVVADEVRSLASKTQESTQEIQTMIESLQNGAEAAVDAMSKGRAQAETCVEQSEHASNALDSITNAVASAHDVSEQISSAATEQQQVSQEISERLEQIVTIAEQTAQGAIQTSQSSSEVAQLAEELRLSVDKFKV